MTDVKRIQELGTRLRSDQARQNGISQREMETCADLLSELARIKGAALSVPEIERRHQAWVGHCGNDALAESQVRQDVATLLDALREVEAARSHLYAECCDAVETSARHLRDLNDARDTLRAKEAECLELRREKGTAQ